MPGSFVGTHVLNAIITLDCCPCSDVCYGVPASVLMTVHRGYGRCLLCLTLLAHDPWPPCLGACYDVTIYARMYLSSMRI